MSAPEEIRSTRSTQAIQAFPFNGDDPDSVIALRSAYDRGRAERNIIDRETLWRLIAEHHQTGATCRCGFYPRLDYNRFSQHIADEILASCHVPLVATREAVRSAVGAVLANTSSYPEPVMRHILGRDMGPLIEKTTDALFISGALVDASASTPTREDPTNEELRNWLAQGIAYFEIHATGEAGSWWLAQIKRVFDPESAANAAELARWLAARDAEIAAAAAARMRAAAAQAVDATYPLGSVVLGDAPGKIVAAIRAIPVTAEGAGQ